MKHVIRTLHPETKVLDESKGLCEYIASDETLDHYREVIRAAGWRFTHFSKNAPFVDSHDYSTIEKLLGSVVDFRIEGRKLIETVQWEPEANPLAKIGWAMTVAGHLRAVSVGFVPVKAVHRWADGGIEISRVAQELGLDPAASAQVSTIYLEQEQIELSACILGANPSALAKAYKDGAIADTDLDLLSIKISEHNAKTARLADERADATRKWEQRERWLREVTSIINKL